jgi:hypothetical protein
VQELSSLIDPTLPVVVGSPRLPLGHPFMNVLTDRAYWTSTSLTALPTHAFIVSIENGGIGPYPKDTTSLPSPLGNYVWCVRGGSGTESQ